MSLFFVCSVIFSIHFMIPVYFWDTYRTIWDKVLPEKRNELHSRCVRTIMGLVYSEPTFQAAYDGNIHQLNTILKTDPTRLDVQEKYTGDTPLIAACRHGNLNVVNYLLRKKANVHLTNKKQRTCLHYVSRRAFSLLDYLMIAILMPVLLLGYIIMLQKQKKNVDLMKAVLNSGVDVNAVDYKGNSALHYVCQKKSRDLVPLLLQHKAKTDIRNNDGETPLDIARRLKFTKIVNMLRKSH